MYLVSITTYPNEQQKVDQYSTFLEEQNWYFGALTKNGQILNEGCNTINKEGNYITYLLAPEQDSVDLKYSNKYVNECYTKLLELSALKPDIEIIGKSTDYELPCICDSPNWYMLYSDWTIHESPVVCGDCGRTVPLYKLPKIMGEEEYYSVLGWQKAYNACDRLFMEGIGERFAYQKLSKVNSDLSELGRKICAEFEKETGKTFYYYLFRYYSSHKSTCPLCGEQWKLEDNNISFVDYCCIPCRLVADKNNKSRS